MPGTDAVETAKGEETAVEKEVTEKDVAAKEGESEQTPEEKKVAEAKAAEDAEKEKNRQGFEKRQREKKRLHDLEIENAELRGFKKAIEKGGKTEGEDTASTLEAEYSREHPEPKEDDHKTWAEFNKAHTRWSVGLAKFEDSRTETSRAHESAADGMRKAIASQKEKGEAEFEDLGDVIGDLSLTTTMLEEIYDSSEGHKLAYYLGMNPKEQDRIAALPAKAQIKEIAKLESKIESGAIQLKKPISKAPDPAPKPGAKGAASDSDEARYADPKTSTKDRIEISKRLQAKREQGQ